MPFLRLSNEDGQPVDDWTHFLIWEAVMDRFTAQRRIIEHEREQREGARRKAKELLDLHRGTATHGGGE